MLASIYGLMKIPLGGVLIQKIGEVDGDTFYNSCKVLVGIFIPNRLWGFIFCEPYFLLFMMVNQFEAQEALTIWVLNREKAVYLSERKMIAVSMQDRSVNEFSLICYIINRYDAEAFIYEPRDCNSGFCWLSRTAH